MDFVCNVCATEVKDCPLERIDREVPSCPTCGSTVRFRGVIHLLSLALHGRSIPLPHFPADKTVGGVGLSDWETYADVLAEKYTYANTFFHTEPFLDIAKPIDAALRASADFLISTDVFEHVAPPLQKAFDGACDLLRPGGHLIFTVPYSLGEKGVEHYPELHDYRVVQFGDAYVVVNRTADGRYVVHENPVFHGGPGTTLEMRIPSLSELAGHMQAAGFTFRVFEANVPEWGIVYTQQPDRSILAKKPDGADARERPSSGLRELIRRAQPPEPPIPLPTPTAPPVTWRSRLRSRLARIANRILPP
jgi:SAM-dependent methyltransferase